MFEKLVTELPKDDVILTRRADDSSEEWPVALKQFWDECGSGYYGGLALHIFGVGYEETFHDIHQWNAALMFFRWLVPDRYRAFGEDAFGNQFLFDRALPQSPVYGLLIQDGVMVTFADSIERFLASLADEALREPVLNYSFYIECLADDIDHQSGQHLTLKVPRALGGDESMGLTDVDAVTNVAYLGQLLENVNGLTPEELRRVRFTKSE
jgi:hypothetical protein